VSKKRNIPLAHVSQTDFKAVETDIISKLLEEKSHITQELLKLDHGFTAPLDFIKPDEIEYIFINKKI